MAELAFASRVIRAVDAPDDLAILKLLPDFPDPVQSFSNFPVPATFLTLVRIDDGTWRVHSLGASIPAAAEVFGSSAGRGGG